MMRIEQNLTLDMRTDGACPVIRAKQGDVSTRFVRVKMTDGGADFPVPEGASAHFRCLKPDGRSCLNPAVIHEDGTVTVELTEQVLAVPGMVWADVFLMGEDGAMLSTLSFQIRVDFAPVGLNVSSENEVQTLLELIRQAGMLEGGLSAYEVAVKNGFVGTEEEWLASLIGAAGPSGPAGATPVRGVDYFTNADQKAMVEDVLEELPVTVASDGFTDLTGLRKLTSVAMTRADDYISLVATLEGGRMDSTVVVMDENGYPEKLVTGNHTCTLHWNGFDQEVPGEWEGGVY